VACDCAMTNLAGCPLCSARRNLIQHSSGRAVGPSPRFTRGRLPCESRVELGAERGGLPRSARSRGWTGCDFVSRINAGGQRNGPVKIGSDPSQRHDQARSSVSDRAAVRWNLVRCLAGSPSIMYARRSWIFVCFAFALRHHRLPASGCMLSALVRAVLRVRAYWWNPATGRLQQRRGCIFGIALKYSALAALRWN